jgi:hypothetical protein
MTAGPTGTTVCWPAFGFFQSELTLMYAVLLVVLLAGGIAIYAAFRWYRTLKEPPPGEGEDLAQFARALEEEGDLAPEEVEKVRAAVEKAKSGTPLPPQTEHETSTDQDKVQEPRGTSPENRRAD